MTTTATIAMLVGGLVVAAVVWVRAGRAAVAAGDAADTVTVLASRVDGLVTDVAYLREALVSERRVMASHLTDHAATNAVRLRARREGHHDAG